MRKIGLGITALAMMFGLNGCFKPSSVDAGKEGVIVQQPYIFGHGGVVNEPVDTGLVWLAWSSSMKEVNIKPFNVDEVFNDLITEDNNPVDFKIHMTFRHIKGRTPALVKNFGVDWYKNNIREPLRNSARTFTKSHKMFEMTTDSAVTDRLEAKVKEEVEKLLITKGIPTELILTTVGKVYPPQPVVDATIQTGVQKQRVKTENERVLAERAREQAETASASADKAYMNELGLTSEQYLHRIELDNQKLAIEKGNNVTIIMGSATPMVKVGGK